MAASTPQDISAGNIMTLTAVAVVLCTCEWSNMHKGMHRRTAQQQFYIGLASGAQMRFVIGRSIFSLQWLHVLRPEISRCQSRSQEDKQSPGLRAGVDGLTNKLNIVSFQDRSSHQTADASETCTDVLIEFGWACAKRSVQVRYKTLAGRSFPTIDADPDRGLAT